MLLLMDNVLLLRTSCLTVQHRMISVSLLPCIAHTADFKGCAQMPSINREAGVEFTPPKSYLPESRLLPVNLKMLIKTYRILCSSNSREE